MFNCNDRSYRPVERAVKGHHVVILYGQDRPGAAARECLTTAERQADTECPTQGEFRPPLAGHGIEIHYRLHAEANAKTRFLPMGAARLPTRPVGCRSKDDDMPWFPTPKDCTPAPTCLTCTHRRNGGRDSPAVHDSWPSSVTLRLGTVLCSTRALYPCLRQTMLWT